MDRAILTTSSKSSPTLASSSPPPSLPLPPSPPLLSTSSAAKAKSLAALSTFSLSTEYEKAGIGAGALEGEESVSSPWFYNMFKLIASISSGWDLLGLFEKKKRKGGMVFTSQRPAVEILERLEKVGRGLGFGVVKGKGGCGSKDSTRFVV
ncbi:hypothetical protein J5N97_017432 [Dioscorea zingiberensis]|uniref:NAF domain-containing protein n=1 Tax=Dioscorea zingiberensis TaxID=325984 RepID=A0A9D5HGK3_9LILI|nr:hypothetical protein J5N97_017432 [Dioscorea zingiberensis]